MRKKVSVRMDEEKDVNDDECGCFDVVILYHISYYSFCSLFFNYYLLPR